MHTRSSAKADSLSPKASLALLLLAVAFAVTTSYIALRMKARDAVASTAVPTSVSVAELRDRDIALFTRRAAEDPESAEDRARLAALWLQRGRERGDLQDYRNAEQAARASVALRTSHNGKAQLILASSLLAQHRFEEARIEAERLLSLDPEQPSYRALLAEIQLELGRYDEAGRSFDALRKNWRDLAVAPRLARWAELTGKPEAAREILVAAVEEAKRRPELPIEQLSWFHLRVADLALRHGQLNEASRAVESGLKVDPSDDRHFALRAKIEAVRGNWSQAVKWGERAGEGADVSTIALVGDAYAALGDSASAKQWWDRADAAGIERQEPFNRQWTQFRLEHDREMNETVAVLRREATERPDVLGLQLLAAAALATGDIDEAQRAISRAMRLGTKDGMLEYTAGTIALEAGDSLGARKHLSRAIEINPYFHHIYAPRARTLLKQISATGDNSSRGQLRGRTASSARVLQSDGAAHRQITSLPDVLESHEVAYFLPGRRTGGPSADEAMIPWRLSDVRSAPGDTDRVAPDTGKKVQQLETLVTMARGEWSAASSRAVRDFDLHIRPRESSQDLLRLAPGLVIAQHAGGGKAEQIFLRGFDADHGTDVAISVDGSPVNLVSHAHGQGYADLHFVIPEVVGTLDVRKGPYDARDGDFATAGAVALRTYDRIDGARYAIKQGSFGSTRALAMLPLGSDSGAGGYATLTAQRTQGPFIAKQDHRRLNGFAKYSVPIGGAELVATASGYGARWDASGQVPDRSVMSGAIGRFGAIDTTEGGWTHRADASLALRSRDGLPWEARVYAARYGLRLFSNFTFFLNDSLDGDGIEQRDLRTIVGGEAKMTRICSSNVLCNGVYTFGTGARHDDADVGLFRQRERTRLSSVVDARIAQTQLYSFVQQERRIGSRLRTQIGARGDLFRQTAREAGVVATRTTAAVSPRGSVALDAGKGVTFFANAGLGFHSNDSRVAAASRTETILPRAIGSEIGARGEWSRGTLGLALWRLDLESELVYVGDEGTTEASGRSRRTGVEADARVRITPWLLADADLTLSRGRFLDAAPGEDRIPLAPRVTSSGGLTARNTLTSAGVRYRIVGDRPADETGAVTAQGHALLELFASRRIGALTFTAGVENLTNTVWNEAQFATTSRLRGESMGITELHYTPGAPRSFVVGVEYRP